MRERKPVPGKSKDRRPKRDAVRPLRVPPPVYPFTAIVGQDEMKLALLLNVIDASIGGVLIMGHRGTGKSTAVRALADLLPQIHKVRDCFYGCDPTDETNLCGDCYARLSSEGKLAREKASVPVTELPLGATEDRVCGTVNIERALKEGVKAFEPGLLARSHRGFLYIDEVNLLEDHLIDLLLDVAVTGRNVVEREGLSVEHPASFRLIGSGNPEEGELRPQLLDRFGLHVEVQTATDLDERVLIVERRQAFERDPAGFRAQAESEQEALRRRLVRAGKKVHGVKLSRELLRQIARLCGELRIDGHRGELSIARAARALSAFEGRSNVTAEDVRRVAMMALRHRLRRDPLEQTGSSAHIEQQLDKLFPPGDDVKEAVARKDIPDEPEPPAPSSSGGRGGNGAGGGGRARADSDAGGARSGDAQSYDAQSYDAQSYDAQHASPPALDAGLPEDSSDAAQRVEGERAGKNAAARRRAGVRLKSVEARRGRYVRAVSNRTIGAKIALDATLSAAALDIENVDSEMRAGGDSIAGQKRPRVLNVSRSLRYKRFKQKEGTLFIFAIDASGSMALNRIAQAKGALARLLQQSYIKRDRVALISFRGAGADVMLRPTGSAERAKRILDALSLGGATPLAAGLSCALEVARQSKRRGAGRIVLLLFTDGRANRTLSTDDSRSGNAMRARIEDELKLVGAALGQASVQTIVVDTQNRFTSSGEAQKLAKMIGGRYVYLPPFSSTGEGFLSLAGRARQSAR